MLKRILAFTVTISCVGLVGCGSNTDTDTTNTIENTTQSPVSNSINGVFDGYKYNIDEYIETTQDVNIRNDYEILNPDNSRFKDGMQGAEKIYGNEENKIKEKVEEIKDNTKENYENIKDNAKNSYEDVKQDSKEAYQKIKDSVRS